MAHFLKRLELNGFKSFAAKTILEFPAGITAVVGPNGSGKSNVVDAIRWLLGERDAKNLRGGKIEDLIFAGTPKRPRVGQASASLHFENHNNFFPVEFPEVSVMRQVSRDGASKYFLNNAEVLLRDLVDFFARARLGSRGLIVVTQGNSDLFLQAPPREKREMIEEILGLREYQLKKEEGKRRLKHTKANLDKARALIEEVLPHLRSLKRQTGRWERRGLLEEELRTLENTFFGTQWRGLQQELSSCEASLKDHQKEFAELERHKKQAEEKQRHVEEREPQGRQSLRELKERIKGTLEDYNRLLRDVAKLEAQAEFEAERGSSSYAPAASEALSLLKKVRMLLEGVSQSDERALREAVQGALSSIALFLDGPSSREENAAPPAASSQAKLEEVSGQLRAIEEKLATLRSEEASLEKGQESFYGAFKGAVSEVERAKDAVEAWETTHRKLQFEREKLTLRLEELKRQIEQAGRSPQEFGNVTEAAVPEEELRVAEKRIFKLRGDLASIGEIDEALLKEANETQERYDFLQHEVQDLEKAIEDLQELVKDVQEKVAVEFRGALSRINDEFDRFFKLMFGGGQAALKVEKQKPKEKPSEETKEHEEGKKTAPRVSEDEENNEEEEEEMEEGIEIILKLPKKRLSSLDVLSGGERSLVGIAALFALISVSPPPFLVLDEIDAALDERNARRFAEMLKEFVKKTQFVVVTHNRATMEVADVLYGVTLEEDGTSKVVSLKLETRDT
jgi:chromosome segregation protein